MRVLHILQMSIPDFSGYAYRSKYIVETQKRIGFEPYVITTYFQKPLNESLKVEEINGIKYFRTFFSNKLGVKMGKSRWISRLEYFLFLIFWIPILKVTKKINPDVIHSHSSFICGIPAVWAGKLSKKPVIYEVRAFWEDDAIANKRITEKSIVCKLARKFENYVLRKADRIVTISEGLKKEVVRRGINPGKIDVVQNGVDCDYFKLTECDENLKNDLGLKGCITIGYLGTIKEYEGLDLVIRATKILREKKYPIKALLVGDGEAVSGLKKLTEELELQDSVIFMGKVPHNEVIKWYSVIDIIVLTRIRSVVTEIVTPLKPLEAMAQEKVVIGSNIGGIKEIIIDGVNGYLFKTEDLDSLVEKTEFVIKKYSQSGFREENARRWVMRNSDWKIIVRKYFEVYEKAMRGKEKVVE